MLNETARKLRDSIGINLDSTELIEAELEYQRNQLNSAYKGTDSKGFDFTLPDKKQISSAVKFAPFLDGANYEQYLNNIYNGFYDTWDNELRTGYMLGTPTKQIIKNVMGTVAKNGEVAQIGSIEKIRQSIERNTRTYLQSMASTARNTLYKENESLFSGYKYLATLDRRTCLVCGKYDGKVFKTLDDAPKVPQHYNCRCTIIPQVKDLDDILSDDTRASENGQVDSKLTYEDWLKAQSEDVQKDVLGEYRYNLFKKGNLKISEFVRDNKIISISEMKSYEKIVNEGIKLDDYFSKIDKNDVNEIEKVLKNINKVKAKNNCVNCAVATDLLMNGYKSEALPYNAELTEELYTGTRFAKLWDNGIQDLIPLGFVDIQKNINNVMNKDNDRAVIRISFGYKKSHIFNVVRTNGMLMYIDSQNLNFDPTILFTVADKIPTANWILKTNGKGFSKDILNCVKKI